MGNLSAGQLRHDQGIAVFPKPGYGVHLGDIWWVQSSADTGRIYVAMDNGRGVTEVENPPPEIQKKAEGVVNRVFQEGLKSIVREHGREHEE